MQRREIRILDIGTQVPIDLAYIYRRGVNGAWVPIAQADNQGRASVTVPDGTRLRFERVGFRPFEASIDEGPTFYLEGTADLDPVIIERERKGSAWPWIIGAAFLALLLSDRDRA